jgi:rod shape-determining protein MreD
MDILRKSIEILTLLAVQVLVLNHIHLGLYALPLLTPLIVVWASYDISPVKLTVTAFLVGLIQDMFAGTPGIGASALTFAAFMQRPLLRLLMGKNLTDNLDPSPDSMGALKFVFYAVMIFTLHHAVFFFLEDFRMIDFRGTSLSALSSLLFSCGLALLVDYVRRKKL